MGGAQPRAGPRGPGAQNQPGCPRRAAGRVGACAPEGAGAQKRADGVFMAFTHMTCGFLPAGLALPAVAGTVSEEVTPSWEPSGARAGAGEPPRAQACGCSPGPAPRPSGCPAPQRPPRPCTLSFQISRTLSFWVSHTRSGRRGPGRGASPQLLRMTLAGLVTFSGGLARSQ